MRLIAFFSVVFFVSLSYGAFDRYSEPLPKVNSDGSIIVLTRPKPISGKDPFDPNNWEPYKFYFKNLDGTYQKNRTVNYPINETGAKPLDTVFYYEDSALIEGLGENFSLINTLTGSVIKKIPESPSPYGGGAVAIRMDDAGKKICMLASHYAEVLDVEKSTWISFTDTAKNPIFQNDNGDLIVLPITSDGNWVTYMLAPRLQNFSLKYNYDIYRTNCFDSKQTIKIGSVPELKVEPGDTGSSNIYVGMQMSAIKIGGNTFVVSRSPSLFTGAPSTFAKIQITPNGVKTLKVANAPGFIQVEFLAFEAAKNQLVAFGDWYKGHNIVSPNNAILDLNSMEVREGAGVNKQVGAYYPINKTHYTLKGEDLLTIGDDPRTLDPSWVNPVTSPV